MTNYSKKAHDPQEVAKTRNAMENKLFSLDLSCDLEAALEFQAKAEEKRKKIAGLQQAIAAEEQKAQQAAAAVPDMGELTTRRETLLADIAIGKKNAVEELAAVEEAITDQRRQVEAAQSDAEQVKARVAATVAGLRRKIEEEQKALDELGGLDLLPMYIMSSAETSAREYVKLAKRLVALFHEIAGLGELLKGCGQGHEIGTHYNAYDYRIPGFSLQACLADMKGSPYVLMNFAHPKGPEGCREAQRERLRALGLKV